jgi:hypothetical protein
MVLGVRHVLPYRPQVCSVLGGDHFVGNDPTPFDRLLEKGFSAFYVTFHTAVHPRLVLAHPPRGRGTPTFYLSADTFRLLTSACSGIWRDVAQLLLGAHRTSAPSWLLSAETRQPHAQPAGCGRWRRIRGSKSTSAPQ